MRDFEVITLEGDKVEGDWALFQEDEGPIVTATFANFEFAEEVIAIMKFKNGMIEVGIGESLRPYNRLYYGASNRLAEDRFWQAVQLHATMGE